MSENDSQPGIPATANYTIPMEHLRNLFRLTNNDPEGDPKLWEEVTGEGAEEALNAGQLVFDRDGDMAVFVGRGDSVDLYYDWVNALDGGQRHSGRVFARYPVEVDEANGFTTIDDDTKLWVYHGYEIEKEQREMVNRILGRTKPAHE